MQLKLIVHEMMLNARRHFLPVLCLWREIAPSRPEPEQRNKLVRSSELLWSSLEELEEKLIKMQIIIES